MTEEEVRRIVRDEVQEEALRVGGIYDSCREVSFNIIRGTIKTMLENALRAYAPAPARSDEKS